MAHADSEGVKLFYEDTGNGTPIVFVHEFAGSHLSWEPQIRYFCRRYRCIAFNARGYPPSDVPKNQDQYSQDLATDDIAAVMRSAGVDKAHIVGMSMGGFAALHFGLRYPKMAISLTVAACGYGAAYDQREQYAEESEKLAAEYENIGAVEMAKFYANGAYRLQFKEKDPRGWLEFREQLSKHSTVGSALTMRGIQKLRPSLYDLEENLKKLFVPVLIVAGDEDDWCIEPGIYLKRTIPRSGLWIVPKTGHTVNLEDPGLFNMYVANFLNLVEGGGWVEKKSYAGASALLSGIKEQV